MSDFTLVLDGDDQNGDGNENGNSTEIIHFEQREVTVTNSENSLSLEVLSPEQRSEVMAFKDKINILDTTQILKYGSGAQSKIASFSDNVLGAVRTKDAGEVGAVLGDLVVDLKGFEIGADEKKGFLSNQKAKFQKMVKKYEKVEVNIEKVVGTLEKNKLTLMKDVKIFDEMFDKNLAYFKELTMYIIAGQEKVKEIKATTMAELREKVEKNPDDVDVQRLNDLATAVDRFEKKLHDLILSRTVSLQMGPQIRMIQNNDSLMIDKIQSTLLNTIPIWKSQMVIALGLQNAKTAMEAQRKVTDTTNELLKRNSEALKLGTIEIAKESERAIIDLETLRTTNRNLVSTLDELLKIRQDGQTKRIAAEAEISKIEDELKQKLLAFR